MHRDIHVNDDRVVFDHVFEIHDDCRSDKGEAEPDGVARNSLSTWDARTNARRCGEVAFDEGPVKANKGSEEEPTHRDYHVRINRDAESHAIVNHDADQCCRRESGQFEANTSSKEEAKIMPRRRYPWTAPRVLAKYLALRMQTEETTVWSIDDYDGQEPWEEEKQEPPAEYIGDTKATTNQYHKVIHELHQCENETDDFLT